MKVFVTGATGVIGRRVVPLLLASGHEVTVGARRNGRLSPRPLIGKFSTARWVEAPQSASWGTRISPMESFSIRVCMEVIVRSASRAALPSRSAITCRACRPESGCR